MPNLHTPERGENESFEDYRERRRSSHAAVWVAARPANFEPLAQHTNSRLNLKRGFKQSVGARQWRMRQKEARREAAKQSAA